MHLTALNKFQYKFSNECDVIINFHSTTASLLPRMLNTVDDCLQNMRNSRHLRPLCWYFHLVVAEEREYPSNPESYAVGSLATGRATLGGQVKG